MLISIVVTLIIVGVLLYLINSFVPMDGKIKQLLNIVVLIITVLYCLKVLGVFTSVKLP